MLNGPVTIDAISQDQALAHFIYAYVVARDVKAVEHDGVQVAALSATLGFGCC